MINRHLGQKSDYKTTYDASLLVAEPRAVSRNKLGIVNNSLPFVGVDIWNGYEVSCLLESGLPAAFIAKVVYPAESEFIVESKSMKLYWNSFNMEKVGLTSTDALVKLEKIAARDLSNLLKTDVKVLLVPADGSEKFGGKSLISRPKISDSHFDEFTFLTLERAVEIDKIDVYTPDKNLLELSPAFVGGDQITYNFHSSLLKSNCEVTRQPDFGDVFISIRGDKRVNPTSLLKYIVSFRGAAHFHEKICEEIYVDLLNTYTPSDLMVMCLYMRRGGWDINPIRASRAELLPNIISPSLAWDKISRQ